MELLEKKAYMIELFDYYQTLLTEKQQAFFKLYYEEDYSLQEIASIHQISRNAVHDHLNKVQEHLISYEQKLKLLALKNERQSYIALYEKTKDTKYLELLKGLDE